MAKPTMSTKLKGLRSYRSVMMVAAPGMYVVRFHKRAAPKKVEKHVQSR